RTPCAAGCWGPKLTVKLRSEDSAMAPETITPGQRLPCALVPSAADLKVRTPQNRDSSDGHADEDPVPRPRRLPASLLGGLAGSAHCTALPRRPVGRAQDDSRARAAAAVGYVRHVDVSHRLEQLTRQMVRSADPGGRQANLARVGLGIGNSSWLNY